MSVTITLSSKVADGKSEILLRVVISSGYMLRAKSGIFISPSIWLTEGDIAKVQEHYEKKAEKKKVAPKRDNGKSTDIPKKPCIDKNGLKGLLSKAAAKSDTTEAKAADNELSSLIGKIELWVNQVRENMPETPDENYRETLKADLQKIINLYHNPAGTGEKEKRNTLLSAMKAMVDGAPNRTVKGTSQKLTSGTIIALKQAQRIVKEYLNERNVLDIEIKDLNRDFYADLIDFCNSREMCCNSIGKLVKNIRVALNLLDKANTANCEFLNPKLCPKPQEDVDNIALTEAELEALANCKLSKELQEIRDQFLMLCWSGSRYSDLGKLTSERLITLPNGRKAFKYEQQKTHNVVYIPLLGHAPMIMDRYNYNLPKPRTNQDFNRSIKRVCEIAAQQFPDSTLNDDETITRTKGGKRVEDKYKRYEMVSAHTGRRTFATIMYRRGIPTITIMSITGHQTETAFLRYIKVSKQEHAEMLLAAFEKSML